jgi:PEP-CTERM motif-containing protein
MRELDATFVLLTAAALLGPVPALAAERDLTSAESSCSIKGGWYDGRFERHACNRPLLRTATDERSRSASLLPLDKPFGAESGILQHCTSGLRTPVYDPDTMPPIESRVNAVDSLDRSSGSDDIWFHLPDALLAPSRDIYLHSLLDSRFANYDGGEEWFRLSQAPPIPEPGGWTMLIAGLLGMCAVARRRIISI